MKLYLFICLFFITAFAQENEPLLPLQVGTFWVYNVEIFDTSNDEIIANWQDSLSVVATFPVADSLWYLISDYTGMDSSYSEYFLGLFDGGCYRTSIDGTSFLEPELFLPPSDRLFKYYETSEGKLYLNAINVPYSSPIGEFETYEFVLAKSGKDETRIYVAPGTGVIAIEDLLDGIPAYRIALVEYREEN